MAKFKSKKLGFTLVELIISITLLAIIGISIGVSLNKVFKARNSDESTSTTNKIKSAADVYLSSNESKLNILYSEKAYIIITIKELKEAGLLSENLKDADGNVITDDKEVMASLDENGTVKYDYPANPNKKEYVQALNVYLEKDEQVDCSVGEGTSNLTFVNQDGKYQEEYLKFTGTNSNVSCDWNKGNSSKIGTYNVKYTYILNDGSRKTVNRKFIVQKELVVTLNAKRNDNGSKVLSGNWATEPFTISADSDRASNISYNWAPTGETSKSIIIANNTNQIYTLTYTVYGINDKNTIAYTRTVTFDVKLELSSYVINNLVYTVISNPSSWTNGNVTVSAGLNVKPFSGTKLFKYCYVIKDNQTTNCIENKVTEDTIFNSQIYSEEGYHIVSATMQTMAGNIRAIVVPVQIDKTKPIYEVPTSNGTKVQDQYDLKKLSVKTITSSVAKKNVKLLANETAQTIQINGNRCVISGTYKGQIVYITTCLEDSNSKICNITKLGGKNVNMKMSATQLAYVENYACSGSSSTTRATTRGTTKNPTTTTTTESTTTTTTSPYIYDNDITSLIKETNDFTSLYQQKANSISSGYFVDNLSGLKMVYYSYNMTGITPSIDDKTVSDVNVSGCYRYSNDYMYNQKQQQDLAYSAYRSSYCNTMVAQDGHYETIGGKRTFVQNHKAESEQSCMQKYKAYANKNGNNVTITNRCINSESFYNSIYKQAYKNGSGSRTTWTETQQKVTPGCDEKVYYFAYAIDNAGNTSDVIAIGSVYGGACPPPAPVYTGGGGGTVSGGGSNTSKPAPCDSLCDIRKLSKEATGRKLTPAEQTRKDNDIKQSYKEGYNLKDAGDHTNFSDGTAATHGEIYNKKK